MSTIAVNQITDASGGNTAQINGATPTAYNTMGRNRIINGDMWIDQRNAGASVNLGNNNTYVVDRFNSRIATGSGATGVQSSTAPTGFTKSFLVTIGTGASPASSDLNWITQPIEGVNTADLNWGTANAKSVTVSFWVRSSVAGTYAISLANDSLSRSYVTTYTINSANTFEYKTITISGETSGTWTTNNSVGVYLFFDLGSGSTRQTSADVWNNTWYLGTPGSVKLVQTSGATFYITGVQLEVGSVATEFERRPYGVELALCQRYFQNNIFLYEGLENDGEASGVAYYKVIMRATPTLSTVDLGGATGAPSGLIDRAASAAQWWKALSGTTYTEKYLTASAEL